MSKQLSTASAIIVAAGSSRRMGKNTNKQFLYIDDTPVLARTLQSFASAKAIDKIIIVTRQEDILTVNDLVREFDIKKVSDIVPGGETRSDSVMCGLECADNNALVAVHDGARPFVTTELINKTVELAGKFGAAAPGVVPKDTVKVTNSDNIVEDTPERNTLRLIQTPQVFRCDELKLAYLRAKESGFEGTDDCSVMERMGAKIHISVGEYTNIKVTTPEDLPIAEAINNYLKESK